MIDYFGFSCSLLGLSISPFFFLHVHQFSLRPREDEKAFGEEQSFTAGLLVNSQFGILRKIWTLYFTLVSLT
uniref:Avr9 elicitor response protein n=1 Tax=Solanum tuberosum TaxID=4113 RepID=M1BRL4_SOLTU